VVVVDHGAALCGVVVPALATVLPFSVSRSKTAVAVESICEKSQASALGPFLLETLCGLGGVLVGPFRRKSKRDPLTAPAGAPEWPRAGIRTNNFLKRVRD